MSTTLQLNFSFAQRRAPRMTALDRVTVRTLEDLARRHEEVWAPTSTIAKRLGVTVRAAQLRVQRLIELGLVERVFDFQKRSRRRLVLLWRKVTTCVDSAPPEFCAHSTNNSALTPRPPLEPPIRSELSLEREPEAIVIVRAGGESDGPTEGPSPTQTTTNPDHLAYLEESPTAQALLSAGLPSEALHAPAGPSTLAEAVEPLNPATRGQCGAEKREPEGTPRRATPAEVDQVVTRARKMFPQLPDPARFVKTLAMRLRVNGDRVGIGWVSDALDWAEHKAARSPFYLTTTVENWTTQGHPGKPPARRVVQQNYNPPSAEPEAEPTAEDIAGLEALAAGTGPAARIAKANLERIRQGVARP